MTPLELEILLHYYSRAIDYREGDFSSSAVEEAICKFINEGMLEDRKADDPKWKYKMTHKGYFFIDYIRNVPLPEMYWRIPTDQVS